MIHIFGVQKYKRRRRRRNRTTTIFDIEKCK